MSNQVPFKYVGNDDSTMIGRSALFEKFGFKLIKNKEYSKEELENYKEKIELEKQKEVILLDKIFNKKANNS